ncbi:hypothetical protein QM480_00670 [Flectobacillus sp. DC10W]|uniref:Uncharacterized protein n=1 Tax=Flectobacillus longus TaxID=2984207 RepID=A0ABT6YGV5_9BACT|nr:hypothetical protein [Flectobacillus longus]MDI9862817.1 hypothetical protein [Flectobacillus longus]
MNWIIRNTSKLKFHTNLKVLLEPIQDEISNLKWLISDLEMNTYQLKYLPVNHDKEWFLISAEEMKVLCKTEIQIIWGVFVGILETQEIEPSQIDLPFADGNGQIWENGNLQVEHSKIEIIAWDSSYTIVKLTDPIMSEKFKAFFQEAIELEKYK